MLCTCEYCSHQFEITADVKGFVRCPACHKPTASGSKTGVQEVTCSSCGTHYAIPVDRFKEKSLVAECKKCGNKFQVEPDLSVRLATKKEENLAGPLEADFLETPSGIELDEEEIGFDEDSFEVDEELSSVEQEEANFSASPSKIPEEPALDFDDTEWPEEDELTEDERGMFIGGSSLPELSSELEEGSFTSPKKSKGPLIATFIFFLFVGLAMYGLVLQEYPELIPAEPLALLKVQFQQKQEIRLSIQEPLKGKWVKNAQIGSLFVLSGTLQSFYPNSVSLSQVQLSGKLLDQEDHVVSEATAWAGRVLPTSRLVSWNEAKLAAFSSLDVNDRAIVKTDEPIEFQVIFVHIEGKVQKLEAHILGFVVDDQPIVVR